MKRFGQLLTVALFATAVWTTSANAVPVFYSNCKVDLAGIVAVDVVIMRISDLSSPPDFTGTWVGRITPTAGQMLAVALTAISLGNQVMCQVDLELDPPQLIRMYATATPLP